MPEWPELIQNNNGYGSAQMTSQRANESELVSVNPLCIINKLSRGR